MKVGVVSGVNGVRLAGHSRAEKSILCKKYKSLWGGRVHIFPLFGDGIPEMINYCIRHLCFFREEPIYFSDPLARLLIPCVSLAFFMGFGGEFLLLPF